MGVLLIAGSLQDYLPGLGFIDRGGMAGKTGRLLTGAGGGLVALPGLEMIGFNVGDMALLGAGGAMALLGILMARRPAEPVTA